MDAWLSAIFGQVFQIVSQNSSSSFSFLAFQFYIARLCFSLCTGVDFLV